MGGDIRLRAIFNKLKGVGFLGQASMRILLILARVSWLIRLLIGFCGCFVDSQRWIPNSSIEYSSNAKSRSSSMNGS
jgi:hypothetical protein